MRRISALVIFAAVACHTDTAVAPDPPGVTPGDVKGMQVGEVRVLTPAQVPNGLEFSTGTSVTDYLVVVANANPTLDVQASYVVRGNLTDGSDRQETVESRIRSFERSSLAMGRSAALAAAGLRASRSISVATVPNVGEPMTLNVPLGDSSNLCKSFITTKGIVRAVSRRAVIVLDDAATQNNTFIDADFVAIGDEFDNKVFPTDSSYFGNPTDIDANSRVVLFYTPEVNKLTPTGQQGFVGGFFFAGDLFPPSGTNGCAESNQREIFYLLAPDPTAKFNNVRTTNTVRQGTRGTIAHEFQHMINAGNRILSGASAFESVWLDEGLGHFAEDAVGRAVRGFGDLQTLTDSDLFQSGNTSVNNDYNAFFFQNLARFQKWLQRPDTSSGLSKNADKNLSSRGASWALVRWSADNFSNSDVRGFTRKLAVGPDTGVKNLTIRAAAPLDTLLSGWMVANYSDHSGIANLAAKYNYRGYNMRSVEAAISSGVYPLMVTTLAAGASVSTTSLSGSGTYYKVNIPAGSARTVRVQDPAGTNASFPGAHIYVLRID